MQKTKIAAGELAEMIRDGLAEEGHDVQVHPNPETGWEVAVISANNAEEARIRAEAIAAGLRQIRQGIGRPPFLFSAHDETETPSARRSVDAARGMASFIGRVRHKIFCLCPASKCECGIALLCFARGPFKPL